MALSSSEIKKIADLSGLELSDQQLSRIEKRFERLFLLVDQMRSVDAGLLEPLDHPAILVGSHCVHLRNDSAEDMVNQDIMKINAPEMKSFLFQVPRILD